MPRLALLVTVSCFASVVSAEQDNGRYPVAHRISSANASDRSVDDLTTFDHLLNAAKHLEAAGQLGLARQLRQKAALGREVSAMQEAATQLDDALTRLAKEYRVPDFGELRDRVSPILNDIRQLSDKVVSEPMRFVKQADASNTYAQVYNVADLLIDKKIDRNTPGSTKMATKFDSLISSIVETVAPASWDKAGGPGAIESFPTNLSIVVSQSQEVHDKIAEFLSAKRHLVVTPHRVR